MLVSCYEFKSIKYINILEKLKFIKHFLKVNGTNILGMQHNKAVDLLRNCGKIANFVLERKIY